MKKRTIFQKGTALVFGLMLTALTGCFTSFAYDSASLTGCTVENQNSIVVKGTAKKDTAPNTTAAQTEGTAETAAPQTETPDDGYYYLFELHPYEGGIGNRTDYAAWSEKTEELSFTLPYSGSATDTMLYSRFVVALKIGNAYREISNPIYVTNPGDVASYREPYPEAM